MTYPLRHSLIVFLALLQLIAPLVHAHASGTRNVAQGVHVPGLEFIATGKNLPGMQAQASHSDHCGILIDISCGMQQGKMLSDVPAILSLDLDFKPLAANFIVAAINFSPQPDILFSAHAVLRPIIPRAPPALLSFA